MALELTYRILGDITEAKQANAEVERGLKRIEATAKQAAPAVAKVTEATKQTTDGASRLNTATDGLSRTTKSYESTVARTAQSLGILNASQVQAVKGFTAAAGASALAKAGIMALAGGLVIAASAAGALIGVLYQSAKTYVEQSGILDQHQKAIDRVKDAWNDLFFVVGSAVVGSGADITTWLSYVEVGLRLVAARAAQAVEELRLMAQFARSGPMAFLDTSLPTPANALRDASGQLTAAGRMQQFWDARRTEFAYVRKPYGGDPFEAMREFDRMSAEEDRERKKAAEDAAKALEKLKKEAKELAERGYTRDVANHFKQLTEWTKAATTVKLHEWIRGTRSELMLLLPPQRTWVEMNAQTTKTLLDMVAQGKAFKTEFTVQQGTLAKLTDGMFTWRDALASVSDSLVRMAQVSGESFGTVVREIANVITSWDMASRSAMAYRKATGTADRVAALAGGAVAVAQATGSGSTLSRVAGGALTGASMGSVVPGVGTAIGAGVGAVVGLVRGLMAPTKYEESAKQAQADLAALRKELIRTYGDLDTARRMADLFGLSLDQAFNAKGSEFTRLDELTTFVTSLNEHQTKLNDALARYGLTWLDLGDKFKQAAIDQEVKVLIEDFALLNGAGADTNKLMEAMAPRINEVFQAAQKAGAELPFAMKPMLNSMIEMGLLVDENGNKIKDLSSIKFAETLTQGFDRVIEAIDRVAKALGYVFDEFDGRELNINTNYTQSGAPPYEPEEPEYTGGGDYYHTGGPIRRAHRGGLGPDEFPIIAQTGEYMMQRSAVSKYGRSFMDAINSGSAGTGVTINVNNPSIRDDRDIDDLADEIVRRLPRRLEFAGR